MAQLTVQIVTPDGLVYDHHASFVSVRTLDGEMGILPRHQNMIAVLAVDEVKVKRVDDDSHVNWIAVNGGIIEIANDEEWGYKTALLGLCAWTGFNIYQALVVGGKLEMLPCLILILSVSVQGFAQTAIKRNMIAGDEEYKEPNKLVQGVILAVVTVIVVLAVGVYFFQKD